MANDAGKRPFWMHQAVEYILGGAMIASGLQSPTPIAPSVCGGLIVLHAASSKGGLAAFRLIGKRLHRTIDLVLIAFTLFAAVQPWVEVEAGAQIIMIGIAAAHAFVWWQSSFLEKERTKRAKLPVIQGGLGEQIGKRAGRTVAGGINAAKRFKKSRSGQQ